MTPQVVKGRRGCQMSFSSAFNIGVCFDVSRSDASHFSYQTLENVKNGRLVTGKYQGAVCLLPELPVVVFANFHPLEDKLSADRWDIVTLDETDTTEWPWIPLAEAPWEETGPAF